jgi:undecaprenyl-diphosphatase
VSDIDTVAVAPTAEAVTILGSIKFLVLAYVITVGWFVIKKAKSAAVMLTTTMVGAIILENALKFAFHRHRPEPFFDVGPETYSFPSGHALFSLCFYYTLADLLSERSRGRFGRAALWTGTAVLIAAIGLSRVYLGLHYPSDIAGGYLAGAFLLAVIAFARRLRAS